MFKKLEDQIKKNSIKESSVSFKTLKEKKEFENKVIFGTILEELESTKIEKAYEDVLKADDKKDGE